MIDIDQKRKNQPRVDRILSRGSDCMSSLETFSWMFGMKKQSTAQAKEKNMNVFKRFSLVQNYPY